jgi:hypothetical protein
VQRGLNDFWYPSMRKPPLHISTTPIRRETQHNPNIIQQ